MKEPSDKSGKTGKADGKNAEEHEEPGSMPLFIDIPPRHVKGSRAAIFFFIALAVLVPIVLGVLFYLLRTLQAPGQ